jgi:hypothetical protein
MGTVAVRIDEATLADVKAVAATRGKGTPGEMLAEAWTEFVENHRAEIAADFEHVAELFRRGDREGMLEFARQTRPARAQAAAARAAG